MKDAQRKQFFTSTELRIIALSLSILSLGLAIAYIGFMLFLKSK
ncbi:MAG: hypothetical protein KatS3mg089_0852 [Patescibacteria group bacterium]|nr:MAG: hypothetical protein KatS3mg089_0852 [Patescibacteria group bacterium]